MSQREQYTKQKLYEEAFNVSFDWEKYLTPKCYEFHDLTCRETNSPVSLQMGVMLPFVSACLGPTTRGCFLTRPSVLNLFWLNVAASGVGKSETRKRLVSEPLEYIFSQPAAQIQDFEVSKFTRAGIEDKLITTNGYCIMITDEGASFLGDLKRYETKHESYISLLNQLFDGKGDKMTLAKNVERPVPRNATALSIGVQQKSYCDAIHGLSETLWLDNGFGERFIFTAARPYRHKWKTNKEAAKKLLANFSENIVGEVLHGILTHHFENSIKYELSEEAEELFEIIIDNYNSQFNLKYSTSSSQLTSSQPELDTSEREDIFVRTKAAELVGRVACVLSIYCNAFESIASGKPLCIPKVITGEYIKYAEEIISISYTQSEKFSSAIFNQHQPGMVHISKPKPSDRERVVQGIIRSVGVTVSVRTLAKNIRHVGTEALKYELRKLQEEGFGRYVDRNEMQKDKVLPSNTCFSAFVKKDMLDLPEKFFSLANNPECNQEMYVNNYDRPMELPLKKVTAIYHTEKDRLLLSVESNMSESTASKAIKFINKAHKRKCGYKTPPRTKLDSLMSMEQKETEKEKNINDHNLDDYLSSSEDVEDTVFRKLIQPTRTGNFDIDCPPSPRVSKGGKIKGSVKAVPTTSKMGSPVHYLGSENMGKESENVSDSQSESIDEATELASQSSNVATCGIKATRKKPLQPICTEDQAEESELDIMGNIRPSGTITSPISGTSRAEQNNKSVESATDKATCTSDMELDISSHKGKSGPRINAHGQVKTSRNCPRPKPPLPIKKKVPEGPLRRSSRQKQIRENMLSQPSRTQPCTEDTEKSGCKKRPLEKSDSQRSIKRTRNT